MRIFGYKKKVLGDEGLLSMKEVTIQTNPKKLREIAQFLMEAADEMEKMKKQFEHKHFKDIFAKKKKDHPDIIIAR